MKKLNVIFYRDVNDLTISIAMKTIETVFKIDTEIHTASFPPNLAFDKHRKQYNAGIILSFLKENYNDFFMMIFPYDLFVSGLNFVFGVAIPWVGCIISTYRFAGEKYEERLRKTIKHELGHVFGLKHCTNPCVMRFANSLWELDVKPADYCDSCKEKLRRLGVLRL